ncbi:hypothetical protein GCM10010412_100660 [Nonomuraea recticatena]|uniref:Uncharacterized protein n=1 Tax=Nonomuraea recticatena TaxID=46178 RepID=A0ABP6FW76_9ACTN
MVAVPALAVDAGDSSMLGMAAGAGSGSVVALLTSATGSIVDPAEPQSGSTGNARAVLRYRVRKLRPRILPPDPVSRTISQSDE